MVAMEKKIVYMIDANWNASNSPKPTIAEGMDYREMKDFPDRCIIVFPTFLGQNDYKRSHKNAIWNVNVHIYDTGSTLAFDNMFNEFQRVIETYHDPYLTGADFAGISDFKNISDKSIPEGARFRCKIIATLRVNFWSGY